MENNDKAIRATGGCLCGAVRYEVRGSLRPVIACHCTQCRRTSGHFVAATATAPQNLVLVEKKGLSWYQSSSFARRGFCRTCGSSLFWERTEGASDHISIMTGTLDSPTGLETEMHIYVEDAGDYYKINDGLPQKTGHEHRVATPK
jgi:hypothetical protein